MKFVIDKKLEKRGGVYKIINVETKKVYIGSCSQFRKRYTEHVRRLHKGNHHNVYLLRSFEKYGPDVFEYHVLEIVSGDKLERTKVEQKYLDIEIANNNWHNCYNEDKKSIRKQGPWTFTPEETRRKISEASKGNKYWLGKKHTEETKEKIRQANLGKKLSAETRKKMSENSKGLNTWMKGRKASKETKAKISQAGKGKTISAEQRQKISNSRKGYKHTEGAKQKMSRAKKGKKMSEEQRQKMLACAEKHKRPYRLLSPTGEVVEGFGIADFCRKNDLTYFGIYRILTGRRKTYKGWRKG